MNEEFMSGYQYNRCVSRGICSINPTTAALQEVIIIYLKTLAFYGLKFEDFGFKDDKVFDVILNTISLISSNYEISERNFEVINSVYHKELVRIVEQYEKLCKQTQVEFQKAENNLTLGLKDSINEYIKFGEREFNKRFKQTSKETLNLYTLLFLLIKSISINILISKSYGIELHKEKVFILRVLNLFNSSKNNLESLKELVIESSNFDCSLMTKLRKIQEEVYGIQSEYEVSFSTTKGKAILVVGSNLKELELILDELKDTKIDVYTHDNMLLAHTFPGFRENKHLKGQYGQGMESCLLDFATFPGPIILTKNSLFNVENLYRGRLFTTDFAYSKGVIPIHNNDLTELLKAVDVSKGFKNGKDCPSEKVGISYQKAFKLLNNKIKDNKFEKIIIIGSRGFSSEEDVYFSTLISHVPDNVLIISLSCCEEKENIVCFNTIYDGYAMFKISEYVLRTAKQKVNIFFPFCDRHTLSILLHTSQFGANKVFIGKWNQIIMKPNILETLKKDFGIIELSTPKKDLSLI